MKESLIKMCPWYVYMCNDGLRQAKDDGADGRPVKKLLIPTPSGLNSIRTMLLQIEKYQKSWVDFLHVKLIYQLAFNVVCEENAFALRTAIIFVGAHHRSFLPLSKNLIETNFQYLQIDIVQQGEVCISISLYVHELRQKRTQFWCCHVINQI